MEKIKRFYLDTGNNEKEINNFLRQQREKKLKLEGAWIQDGRYLFLKFESCIKSPSLPRELVRQGKKARYRGDISFFRQSVQQTSWEVIAELEIDELYLVFLRHR